MNEDIIELSFVANLPEILSHSQKRTQPSINIIKDIGHFGENNCGKLNHVNVFVNNIESGGCQGSDLSM